MKSVHGLIDKNKIKDGQKDNKISLRPDDNKGLAIGIWNPLKDYTGFKVEMNNKKPGTLSYGTHICHYFSTEEKKKVLKYLEKWKEKEIKGQKVIAPPSEDFGILEKWFDRLVDLFKNQEPVYYWAG